MFIRICTPNFQRLPPPLRKYPRSRYQTVFSKAKLSSIYLILKLHFLHIPTVQPKQLCALAHLGCSREAGTSQLSSEINSENADFKGCAMKCYIFYLSNQQTYLGLNMVEILQEGSVMIVCRSLFLPILLLILVFDVLYSLQRVLFYKRISSLT